MQSFLGTVHEEPHGWVFSLKAKAKMIFRCFFATRCTRLGKKNRTTSALFCARCFFSQARTLRFFQVCHVFKFSKCSAMRLRAKNTANSKEIPAQNMTHLVLCDGWAPQDITHMCSGVFSWELAYNTYVLCCLLHPKFITHMCYVFSPKNAKHKKTQKNTKNIHMCYGLFP